MSVSETRATVELVRRIAKDLTIIIVEHDMEVVMGSPGLSRCFTTARYSPRERRRRFRQTSGCRRST